MQIRNPVFTANGSINCEIEHPQYGWIPFTASSADPDALGREIYAAALAMGPAPYIPVIPTPEEITANLKRQRANAYRVESDPLFFKWQAGEETESVWTSKRAEIRARFPYPEI
jgi:hypothetical protein